MTLTAQQYDKARAAIAASGFDAEVQTRISLFLGAAKSVNAAILGAFELQPKITVAYPFVHGQYCREVEFAVVGSSRVDLQACKLEYSIVSPK